MADKLKTYGLVTGLALLIWAFAEVQSLRTQDISANVSVETPAPDLFVGLPEEWTGAVSLRVEGGTGSVDDIEEALRVPVRIGVPAEPGRHTVNLANALRESPAIAQAGVTIAETDPETLDVEIVRMTTRDVPVSVVLEGVETDGQPTPEPAQIRVHLPAESELSDSARFVVRIGDELASGLTPGRSERLVGLGLEAPETLTGLPGVRYEPERVDVQLRLRSRTASIVLPSVPVHVQIAAVGAEDWIVRPESQDDQFLRDVTVTGPSAEIARIERGELRITARAVLSFTELERAVLSGGNLGVEAVFSELPTSLAFSGDSMRVNLVIERRPSE